MEIKGQENLIKEVSKVFEIFKATDGHIKPHFILTGPSGSGKSLTIATLCKKHDINFLEVNAAQITKEGTSGNSLSKVLAPLSNRSNTLNIVFVDEFDKLFISGNSNDSSAHESTTGVQNEFLKLLEGNTASVFGDYGKYNLISIKKTLFIFAGAFNNEENISIDRLREIGVKTEFIGRVGLIFNTNQLTFEDLISILKNSPLLENYLHLFKNVSKNSAIDEISSKMGEMYELNTLGARMINTLIHQYFIKGGLKEEESKKITFQKQLSFN